MTTAEQEQKQMDELFETRAYDEPAEDWTQHPELGEEGEEEEEEVGGEEE